MSAETCPATLPFCMTCGVRGCGQHETWVNAEIDWRKPRKKRLRKHR